MMILSARISIGLPPDISQVPVTLQTFILFLLAACSRPRTILIIVLLYLIIGACGLPVFSGGEGGAYHLYGPTAGYLLGFLPAAWVVSFSFGQQPNASFLSALKYISVGTVIVLICGMAWLSYQKGLMLAWQAGAKPFLPGAIIKILAAGGCWWLLKKKKLVELPVA